jgi:hypothetical protein
MKGIRGSCLCGGVRFEITGPLTGPLNCHCSMCRKAQGAAFRSRVGVRVVDFHWLSGEELVTYYESSPGAFRGFCRVCGSPVVTRLDPARYPDQGSRLGVALGLLDDDPGVRPRSHVFVASKAPWFEITDDLPQYAELPPSF